MTDEEECEVSQLQLCEETVKRKTAEIEPEKALVPTVKLQGKALRKDW